MKALLESAINISTSSIPFLNRCINLINSTTEVALLDIHRGESVNRSVLTICGTPNALIESLYHLITETQLHVDMRLHQGTHPRIGAIDVCPIIPIRGITENEALRLTQDLAKRVATQNNIPIYLYEQSAHHPKRRFLYNIRRGNYESLKKKIQDPDWIPDYGPTTWSTSVARSGATVIGVRPLMVAWNLSLKNSNRRFAQKIAVQLRGSGFIRNGIRRKGIFPSVRAIGWTIPEYNCAQISLNIYNVQQDSMVDIFKKAQELSNQNIAYSERIGLIPLSALKLSPTAGVDDVKKATGTLNIKQFHPKHHILEYAIKQFCDKADFSEDYPCLPSFP
jgi:glutamate formiminotransferase